MVQDNRGTANGGPDTSAIEPLFTVNFRSVNDVPSFPTRRSSDLEDIDYAFLAGDFSFTDASDSPPNGLAAVLVTRMGTDGSRPSNGGAPRAGALPKTVSAADLAGGKLVLRPAANAFGSPYSSVKF